MKLKFLDYTLIAILLFALFAFGYPRIRNYIVHRKTVNNPNITALTFRPGSSLNLGKIKKGNTREFGLTVINAGTKKLFIRDVHVSCGCTKVELTKYNINAGDSATLHGTIDTQDKTGVSVSKVFFSSNTAEKNHAVFLNYEVQ